MTKRQLRNNVIGVIVFLFVVFATAISAKLLFSNEQAYILIKDFSSVFIAVAAAYLAYCFQRRQAFLASLRDLWKEIIDAKIEIHNYMN